MMFYVTRLKSVGNNSIVDERGKMLQTLSPQPLIAGDIVCNDGKKIFGDSFEGTQLTGFLRSGIPVLGTTDNEKMRGYIKDSGLYKKYPIAEGDYIVNSDKSYFHPDGDNVLDAEIKYQGKQAVGYYSARATNGRTYEATLAGSEILEDVSNELKLSVTPNKGNPQELRRLSMQSLLDDVLKTIQEITDEYKKSWDETYAEDTELQVTIVPDVLLKVKINNLKIGVDKKAEMIYSTSGQGDIRFITNFERVSTGKYTRAEFLNKDFLMDHEEYGGDKHLKEALLTLWDFNLNYRDPDFLSEGNLGSNEYRIDIFDDSKNKVKITEIEVKEYKRVNKKQSVEPDSSDTTVYFELRQPVEADYLIHANDTVEPIKSDLFKQKNYLHSAKKTTGGFDKRKVSGKKLMSHNPATNYMAKVACVDGLGENEDLYPFDLPIIYSPNRGFPAALHVMIMPILERPYPYNTNASYFYYDVGDHFENQEELETADVKFAMHRFAWAAGGQRAEIGLVKLSEIETITPYEVSRIGTGFAFFHGNITTASVQMGSQIFPLQDKIMYQIIVRAELADGEKVELPMVLTLSGLSGCSVTKNTTAESNNQSEFIFPVQDEYIAKYRRNGADDDDATIGAEEKAWEMTGIYESDTQICGSLPTQTDKDGNDISSINYNVAITPLKPHVDKGYVVGVHDGKLYNSNDFSVPIGDDLKNFRLRKMKNIAKART